MDNEHFIRRLRRRVYGLMHKGDKYNCPFCKQSFSRFLSGGSRIPELQALGAIGIGKRRNARCPNCGSNDRARLLFLFLDRTQLLSANEIKLLEIAPDRHLSRAIRSHRNINYVCGALFPEDYSDLDAQKIDVTAIPFADCSFDVILCNHVLQQVPDHLRAMREIRRVLKPTGWAILQVPLSEQLQVSVEDATVTDASERRRKFGSTDSLRLYGQDYFKHLGEAGLEVQITHPTIDGWCKDAERYAVIAQEKIFVVRPSSN